MDGNVSIAETCDSSSSVTGMGDFESVSLRGDHTENRQMGELSVSCQITGTFKMLDSILLR